MTQSFRPAEEPPVAAGRRKDLIIIRGRNHYPQDIELTAERAHPALRPGCAAAFSVDEGGEERLALVQEVRREALSGLDAPAVTAAIRQAVAAEHDLAVWGLALLPPGQIPRTASGEVRRHACRQAFAEDRFDSIARSVGADDPAAGAPEAAAPGPASASLELSVRSQAARAMEVAPETLALDRPLALDSLAAIELRARIEDELGVELPLGELLEAPTLGELVEMAAEAGSREAAEGSPRLVGSADPPDEFPLSHGQRALWFLQRLAPDSGALNIRLAARLPSRPDPGLLAAGFGRLVERHPALRTAFAVAADGAVARVLPAEPAAGLERVDAAGWSGDELAQRLAAAAERPFDLERGAVWRLVWFDRGEEAPVLLLAIHHAAADLASLMILADDLAAELGAATGDAPPADPPPPVAYSDYVAWQRELLASAAGEAQWRGWSERLADEPPALELPLDRPRPPVPSLEGAVSPFRLSPRQVERVEATAAAAGATPFTVLLAALFALLSRISGQRDLLVGTPAAGRSLAGLERLVGYLVNPLPLRVGLGGRPSFRDLVERTKVEAVGALARQDFPFPLLVERLAPERAPGRLPLAEVLFALQSPRGEVAGASARLGGFVLGTDGGHLDLSAGRGSLPLESVRMARRSVQFDLELLVTEEPGGWPAAFLYKTALFDATTAQRLGGWFRRLLAAALDDPRLRLDELPLLAPAERHQLLAESNDTRRDLAVERPLFELAAARAAAAPDAVALSWAAGAAREEAVTYGALIDRALGLAELLVAAGAGPEVAVAVALERSPDLVATLLAVLAAGAVFVPLDPAYPPERLSFMLSDSGARVVVTRRSVAPGLAEQAPSLLDLDHPPAAGGLKSARRSADLGSPAVRSPDQLAYLIYTSGSTGRPKAVAMPHRGLSHLALFQAEVFGLEPGDGVLQFASISFDSALGEIALALVSGATLHLAPKTALLPGAELATLLRRRRIRYAALPPSALDVLDPSGLSALTTVISAGEACTPRLVRRWSAGRWLYNGYGPTEVGLGATMARLEEESGRTGRQPPPIGRSLSNSRVYLLDRALRPVPTGVLGEVALGGAGLARGYRGKPGLTAASFVPDPFGTGGRLYRTGDLARRRGDGQLVFAGRIDDQVKIRGFRVEVREVEAALRRLAEVRDAVVDPRGDGRARRLVAWFVPAAGAGSAGELASAVADLKAALRRRLPEHMVPSAFVPLDALPRTPSGKVDRRALQAPAGGSASGGPSGVSAAGGVAAVDLDAARGELAAVVVEIWRQVLGVDAVGLDDNFFDLGGHSLAMAEVHRRLGEAVDEPPSMVDLFRYPTVRSLVDYLGGEASAAAAVERGRSRAAVRRAAAGSGDAVAVVGMAGRFPGAADVEALWSNSLGGVDSIRFFDDAELAAAGVPESLRRDPGYVPAAGALDDIDLFDAGYFGYNPREAELLDPQQRLFLEVAVEALDGAALDPGRFAGAVGVFAGTGIEAYMLRQLGLASASAAEAFQLSIGNLKDFVATRLAYTLDLSGPAVTVQSACSTSLVAVHLACRSLLAGECDAALAGGASVAVPQAEGYLYQPGMILSPDGHCRPFDAEAAGTVRGSGVGVVVLRRLSDALAAGDPVRAVIRGSAINNDGARKVGYTAPSVERQAAVIAEAWSIAGLEPGSAGFWETHGTGTDLGDPIEIEALREAIGSGGRDAAPAALGALKANVGHLDAAAGVAGLIKAVLTVERGEIPPLASFRRPNPALRLEGSPLWVPTEPTAWPESSVPRRAGVSSFGIGGTNAHAVVEQAPPPAAAGPARRPRQLLVLSARSEEALAATAGRLAGRLAAHPPAAAADLADAAFTLSLGRRTHGHRLAVVSEAGAAAAAALEDPGRWVVGRTAGEPRRVGFLFPGQGAQHPGMTRDLYRAEPRFRERIDEGCAAAAEHLDGLDLRSLLYPEDFGGDRGEAAGRLTETANAQPALYIVEHALAGLWMDWGVEPVAMLGHSLGEYVAAAIAGVFTYRDGLRLVIARGRLMQAMPRGSMLAVSLSSGELEPRLGRGGGALSVAAINAPGSTVVSGPEADVEALMSALAAEGVTARRLETSHAYHSPLMDRAVAPFLEEVQRSTLSPPRSRFVSNLSGDWITAEEATDPEYWARHLRQPVRFSDGVAALFGGADALLEVGPGQALSALSRRHPERPKALPVIASLPSPRAAGSDDAHLLGALGRLWCAGVAVDWERFWAGEERRRVELPASAFDRRRYWAERRTPVVAEGKRPLAADWLYRPRWAEQARSLTRRSGPEPVAVLLLQDESGPSAAVAEALARSLGERRCVRVRRGAGYAFDGNDQARVSAQSAADLGGLLDALAADESVPAGPLEIVHLWSLIPRRSAGPGSSPGLEGDLEDGLYTLLALGRALAARPELKARITVVASGLCRVVGGEGVRPGLAAVLGLARVMPQELPGCRVRSVDVGGVSDPDRVARDVLYEITAAGSPAPVVAYRDASRWVEEFRPLVPAAEREAAASLAPPLRRGGTYLITGGLGGIGRTLARSLAAELGARLVLVGRSAGREGAEGESRAELVRELEALGSEVLVRQADVGDPDELSAAVSAARERFGALHGVIHAAGLAGRAAVRPLADTRREHAEAQLQAKARGVIALDRALAGEELDFCVLFSSLSTVLGGLGFAAYAAANAVMDALAAGRGDAWISIDWEGWRPAGGDAQAAAGEAMELALTGEEGVEALRRVLALAGRGRLGPLPRVVVSTGDLAARLARWTGGAGADESPPPADRPRHARPDLQTPYVAPEGEAERRLAEIWQRLLGVERVGLHDNFFELGGTSLLGIQVIAEINRLFGSDIEAVSLFESPTVKSLAQVLGGAAGAGSEAANAAAGERLERSQSRGDRRRLRFARRTPAGRAAGDER